MQRRSLRADGAWKPQRGGAKDTVSALQRPCAATADDPIRRSSTRSTRSLVALTSTKDPGGHQFDPGRVQRGSLCADVDAAVTGSSNTVSTLHLLSTVRADVFICKV